MLSPLLLGAKRAERKTTARPLPDKTTRPAAAATILDRRSRFSLELRQTSVNIPHGNLGCPRHDTKRQTIQPTLRAQRDSFAPLSARLGVGAGAKRTRGQTLPPPVRRRPVTPEAPAPTRLPGLHPPCTPCDCPRPPLSPLPIRSPASHHWQLRARRAHVPGQHHQRAEVRGGRARQLHLHRPGHGSRHVPQGGRRERPKPVDTGPDAAD